MRTPPPSTGRAGLLLALALVLPVAAGAQAPPPPPSQTSPAPEATQDQAPPRSLTVYLPTGTEDAAGRPGEPVSNAIGQGKPVGESPATLVFAALFVLAIAGVFAFRRIHSPQCPRCRQKMVELEREGGAADPEGLQVLACLGCREVVKRRYRALATRDLACPSCQAAAKVARLEVVERPGYLTWGKARVHDECARCTYRRSVDYDVPPLEAPVASRLAPRTGR